MLTIAMVQKQVAEYYSVDDYDFIYYLKCASRLIEFTGPRHVAMYLCRKLIENGGNKLSYKKIGKEFGDRHHSTVMSAVRGIEWEMKYNEKLKADVCFLINSLQINQHGLNVNYIYVEK